MTKQVKEQIKAAAIIFVVIIAGVLVQGLYIRMKQAEDAVKGYERRSDKANHTIDSLSGLNAERMAQIEVLREQLEFNKQQYEANISAIDSLDRNGLRRAMHNLLASLTDERYPGQSND
jgi:membrane protein involved in colicin uptake